MAGFYGEDDSGYSAEHGWTMWLLHLLASLTRHRMRHLLFYTHGPGLLAGLLSDEPTSLRRTQAEIKHFERGWQRSSDCAQPAQVAAKSKSWMARPIIRYMMERVSASEEGTVHDSVLQILDGMFAMVTTKPIEDGFQRLRVQEQRGQSSKTVTLDRMWHTLVTQGVLPRSQLPRCAPTSGPSKSCPESPRGVHLLHGRASPHCLSTL